MKRQGLDILQVSTSDSGGGAERIALNTHRHYLRRGHNATLAVGHKSSDDDSILQIGNAETRGAWARAWAHVAHLLHTYEHRLGNTRRVRAAVDMIARPKAWIDTQLGHEHFGYPGTAGLLGLPTKRPDLVHLHNLHGDYFDLRALPMLSRHAPVFITMHDAWLLSGHCAHSFGCDRWRTGCGQCPSLNTYPAVKRDATARNWRLKQSIYSNSRVYLTAPSHWLLEKAKRSILAPAVLDSRVIHNGIDLGVFHPGRMAQARHRLALPENAHIVLVAANGIKGSDFKDAQLLRAAVSKLSHDVTDRPILCVALGDTGDDILLEKARVQFVAPQTDPTVVADYYRAADIYAHPAKADNFPTVVIEAMACGTPVVATRVGGIPEQVDNGQTGLLVPVGDATMFGAYMAMLLNNPALRESFSEQGIIKASLHYNLQTQADLCLDWYEQVIHNVRSQGTRLAA